MQILIIDDDVQICNLMRQIIKHNCKYDGIVDIVYTGLKGLEYTQNKTYDVIFLDLLFERESGMDLISKIKDQGKHGKLIIISGYNNKRIINLCMKLGADDFWVKPVNPQHICNTINKLKNQNS